MQDCVDKNDNTNLDTITSYFNQNTIYIVKYLNKNLSKNQFLSTLKKKNK